MQITVDTYGHLIPGANRGAVNRLARAVDDAKVRETATPAQPTVTTGSEVVAEVLDKNGAPGVTRTPGTQFRKLLLYPPELRGRFTCRLPILASLRARRPETRSPGVPSTNAMRLRWHRA